MWLAWFRGYSYKNIFYVWTSLHLHARTGPFSGQWTAPRLLQLRRQASNLRPTCCHIEYSLSEVDCVWNVMAHAQKPDFISLLPSTFVSVDYFVSHTVNFSIYACYFTSSAHCRSQWLPELFRLLPLGHKGHWF